MAQASNGYGPLSFLQDEMRRIQNEMQKYEGELTGVSQRVDSLIKETEVLKSQLAQLEADVKNEEGIEAALLCDIDQLLPKATGSTNDKLIYLLAVGERVEQAKASLVNKKDLISKLDEKRKALPTTLQLVEQKRNSLQKLQANQAEIQAKITKIKDLKVALNLTLQNQSPKNLNPHLRTLIKECVLDMTTSCQKKMQGLINVKSALQNSLADLKLKSLLDELHLAQGDLARVSEQQRKRATIQAEFAEISLLISKGLASKDKRERCKELMTQIDQIEDDMEAHQDIAALEAKVRGCEAKHIEALASSQRLKDRITTTEQQIEDLKRKMAQIEKEKSASLSVLFPPQLKRGFNDAHGPASSSPQAKSVKKEPDQKSEAEAAAASSSEANGSAKRQKVESPSETYGRKGGFDNLPDLTNIKFRKNSILHCVQQGTYEDVVAFLNTHTTQNDLVPDHTQSQNWSAMSVIMWKGDPKVLQAYVNKVGIQACVNQRAKQEWSFLQMATLGPVALVATYIELASALLTENDYLKAIMTAARHNRFEAFQLLFPRIKDVNATYHVGGKDTGKNLALSEAIVMGATESTETLEAHANLIKEQGLMLTMVLNNPHIELNDRQKRTRTPLAHFAALMGSPLFPQVIQDRRVDIKAKDASGRSILDCINDLSDEEIRKTMKAAYDALLKELEQSKMKD